jgi:acyl carrier protein
MNETLDVLVSYIRDEIGFTGAIAPDQDLLTAGVLDSFNIVTLALFAQERFGIELDADDLVRENLARLTTLAELIDKRRAEQKS